MSRAHSIPVNTSRVPYVQVHLGPPANFVPPPKPKSPSLWVLPVVLFGAFGACVLAVSTCLVMSASSHGSNPDEIMKSLAQELENERRTLESRSNDQEGGTHIPINEAPPYEQLPRKRTNEDAGADGSSTHASTDASPGKAIGESSDDLLEPTILTLGIYLWMREPIKDSRTGKPAKYASIQLAEAACSQRPGGWRLPSVREFRLLTKNDHIDETYFLDYPIGAFWATPDTRVAISASGAFDSYDGPAQPMALCMKIEDGLEEP